MMPGEQKPEGWRSPVVRPYLHSWSERGRRSICARCARRAVALRPGESQGAPRRDRGAALLAPGIPKTRKGLHLRVRARHRPSLLGSSSEVCLFQPCSPPPPPHTKWHLNVNQVRVLPRIRQKVKAESERPPA